MKIVSLVPSLTELLFDLGLESSIVGRTKFCIHPAGRVASIPKIGGTKKVHVDKVIALEPDLIIANKEENQKEDVEALAKECKVLLTEIANYDQAIAAIKRIGVETSTRERAIEICQKIELQFSRLRPKNPRRRVCYLIWQKPYMTIGHDTYIHDMLGRCGFDNIAGGQTRYPTLTIEEMITSSPDYVFLSSEPFPFKQKHIDELQLHLPDAQIILVDGEYFSWYGSRMIGAAKYFKELDSDLI